MYASEVLIFRNRSRATAFRLRNNLRSQDVTLCVDIDVARCLETRERRIYILQLEFLDHLFLVSLLTTVTNRGLKRLVDGAVVAIEGHVSRIVAYHPLAADVAVVVKERVDEGAVLGEDAVAVC